MCIFLVRYFIKDFCINGFEGFYPPSELTTEVDEDPESPSILLKITTGYILASLLKHCHPINDEEFVKRLTNFI